MYAKYSCELNESQVWEDESREVYENVKDAACYKKIVFFHPEGSETPVWLWSAGHECAIPTKTIDGRMWRSRWVLHVCVRGKGYYNGQLIEPGTAFISWPRLIHSIRSDSDEPFEFYWFMLRGDKLLPTVRDHGFRSDSLIFKCDYTDDMASLINVIVESDYLKTNVKVFNECMMKILLSYNLFQKEEILDFTPIQQGGSNYVNIAKNLLYDYNYSLSVSELAKKIGISSKHLNVIFRKVQGESPKEYILRKKLLHSIDLLKGGTPPTEVSQLIGYADYSSFYRAFVTQFGISPRDYLEKGK